MTNIEHLLVDRYECIAPVPLFGLAEEGRFFTKVGNDKNDLQYTFIEDGEKCRCRPQFDLAEYPHLFRKLHWAEKREIGELPEYVKCDNVVYKVIKWNKETVDIEGTNWGDFTFISEYSSLIDVISPSTEQDYLTYQNSLK